MESNPNTMSRMTLRNTLSERFSKNKDFNPINLSQAIERQETESLINDWWNRAMMFLFAFLQGEEGTGKTWLAAKWMKSIHESENIMLHFG